MPIAYTMKIDGQPELAPSINGHEHVVTRALWTMTGEAEDGLKAEFKSSTEFPAPTEEDPFTAFSALTEETVIGWVEAHANDRDPEYLDKARAFIAAEIEVLRNPYVAPKAPWIEEPAQAEDKA